MVYEALAGKGGDNGSSRCQARVALLYIYSRMNSRGNGGWWVFTLFVTNEIPSVVVTFVALIMFLQMGVGMTLATAYAALLLLPWVAQPLMRSLPAFARDGGEDRHRLLWTECLMSAVMVFFALRMGNKPLLTLLMLFIISILSAWHDLLARRYYADRVGNAPGGGTWMSVLRTLSSQMATVLTYGLMIMAVGVLEIYFRQRAAWYSWALCCYMLAGCYMLLTVANMLLLDRTHALPQPPVPHHRRRQWVMQAGLLALMLLPQGLMFFSRTIFLLARPQEGGLGCTLQEVGFAQGTIGVIAFLLGVTVGQRLQRRRGEAWMELPLTLCLGLSPLAYLTMTYLPPGNLGALSAYTFLAQLLFGLGLNGCRRRIEHISGERYRNAVNPLYIPIVSLCLLLPMAASGFMAGRLTFRGLFLVDTLCAPASWAVLAMVWMWHRAKARTSAGRRTGTGQAAAGHGNSLNTE